MKWGLGASERNPTLRIEIDVPEITRVSHARVRMWRRCQMRHHYKYYQKLVPRRRSAALRLGSIIHTLIEAQHERGSYTRELNDFKKEFMKLFAEERQELGDLPAKAKTIVKGYFQFYEGDGLDYAHTNRRKNTELKVHFDMGECLEYIGYIDTFPRDEQRRLWVMDHKTCRSIPDEETRFSDLQLVLYHWALPMAGFPEPYGTCWDYLRTKEPARPELLKNGELSRRKNIDTTYEAYMQAAVEILGHAKAENYREWAMDTLRGKEEAFYRRIFLPRPSNSLVKMVVQDIMATAKEIQANGPKAQVRNMQRDCKQCPYYILCQSEVRGLDSEFVRKMEFKIKGEVNGGSEEDVDTSGSEE